MAEGLQMAVELHDGDKEERRRGWRRGSKRRGEASACLLASTDGTGPTSKETRGEREQGAMVVLNNSSGWLGDQRRRRGGVVAGGKTGEDAATIGSSEEGRGKGKRAPVKMKMAAFLGDDGGGRRWEHSRGRRTVDPSSHCRRGGRTRGGRRWDRVRGEAGREGRPWRRGKKRQVLRAACGHARARPCRPLSPPFFFFSLQDVTERDQFTPYQAAKFQGEVLNMRHENKKVANELKAGLNHVRGLQAEIEKALLKLHEEFELSGSKSSQHPHFRHLSTKTRIPLRSFLFGTKPKKASIFSCMNPVFHKQYSDVSPGSPR